MKWFLIGTVLLIIGEKGFASEARTASFIANKISYLSAHHAKNYVTLFREEVKSCLSRVKASSRKERISCSNEAIDAIRNVTESQYSEQIMRNHMSQLRRDGHISRSFAIPDRQQPTFGVLGDSLSVGALAAEHIEAQLFDLLSRGLLGYMTSYNPRRPNPTPLGGGAFEKSSRVLRIFDSPENRSAALSRPFEKNGSRFADCEECSFAYTVARNLGVPESNIFFAGQDGKQISHLDHQLIRLALPLGHLPDTVLITFTANSLCHPNNQERTPEERYQWYVERMTSSLHRGLSEVSPSPNGTEILIVAAADITNLLENESVLSKPIYSFYSNGSFSRSMTCRDMRTGEHGASNLLSNMCPFIYQTHPDDTDKIEHIRALHGAVVRAQRDVTHKFNSASQFPGIRFRFLDNILNVQYEGADVSSDCFHPSTNGHDKIAESVLEEI